MNKSAIGERRENALFLYIFPKMTRGLDFPFPRDYDKRNVPVHIEPCQAVFCMREKCEEKF
jgi:hypothetical protein